MFSQALIEAYQLESKDAIYPRIVISENLFEYFKPFVTEIQYLLKEKDGFYFVDYLANADKESCRELLGKFNCTLQRQSLSVKEKYYWLYKYWEYKFNEELPFSVPQFSR